MAKGRSKGAPKSPPKQPARKSARSQKGSTSKVVASTSKRKPRPPSPSDEDEDEDDDILLPPKRAAASTSKVRRRYSSPSDNVLPPPPLPPKKPAVSVLKGKRRYESPSGEDDELPSPSQLSPRRRRPAKKSKSAATTAASEDDDMDVGGSDGGTDKDGGADESDDVLILPDAAIPDYYKTKARADDLDLMFEPIETVLFKGENKDLPVRGRYCMLCKKNKVLVKKNGIFKAFFRGSNSTLRFHCQQHWDVYKKLCSENKVELRERCMPPPVLKKFKEDKEPATGSKQATLQDMGMATSNRPKAFATETVLEHVSKYICTADVSLATADNVKFRNMLVAMRPTTRSSELPTAHTVSKFIHNEFVDMLQEDKESIQGAIGAIAMTADSWTAKKASGKTSYLGATGSWMLVVLRKKKRPVWRIRTAIIGFRALEGEHSGHNLGRFLFSLCMRVGIVDVGRKMSKLGDVTLDNAANNGTLCEALEKLHQALELQQWDAVAHQLMCLAHILNLGIVAVMNKVTSMAAIETTQAMWEYDPNDEFNRVLGGSLDVIAAIRTLAVKIQASGQRIKYFHQLQRECEIKRPLSITLHGNTRWGTAHGMIDRALTLKTPINRFITSADERFGDITVIRVRGKTVKKLKWSAFKFDEDDWARAKDCLDILKDPNDIQHLFSAQNVPTIYQVIPAFEGLLSKWEKKLKIERFAPYYEALEAGLAKFRKYYNLFDKKPAYILTMFIHPFYKLDWFQLNWGGAQAQREEIAAGNPNAKNWQEEAMHVVESAMAKYWPIRLTSEQVGGDDSSDEDSDSESDADNDEEEIDDDRGRFASPPPPTSSPTPSSPTGDNDGDDDELNPDELYAKKRTALLQTRRSGFNGWSAELRSWLKHVPSNVSPETDLCKYWAKHGYRYPTIARIAIDYIPSHGTAVPCESMFSSSGETNSHLRSQLGTKKFEELQMMKARWRADKTDFARLNENTVSVVDMAPFTALLEQDELEGELEAIGAVWDSPDEAMDRLFAQVP